MVSLPWLLAALTRHNFANYVGVGLTSQTKDGSYPSNTSGSGFPGSVHTSPFDQHPKEELGSLPGLEIKTDNKTVAFQYWDTST